MFSITSPREGEQVIKRQVQSAKNSSWSGAKGTFKNEQTEDQLLVSKYIKRVDLIVKEQKERQLAAAEGGTATQFPTTKFSTKRKQGELSSSLVIKRAMRSNTSFNDRAR